MTTTLARHVILVDQNFLSKSVNFSVFENYIKILYIARNGTDFNTDWFIQSTIILGTDRQTVIWSTESLQNATNPTHTHTHAHTPNANMIILNKQTIFYTHILSFIIIIINFVVSFFFGHTPTLAAHFWSHNSFFLMYFVLMPSVFSDDVFSSSSFPLFPSSAHASQSLVAALWLSSPPTFLVITTHQRFKKGKNANAQCDRHFEVASIAVSSLSFFLFRSLFLLRALSLSLALSGLTHVAFGNKHCTRLSVPLSLACRTNRLSSFGQKQHTSVCAWVC